MFTSLLIIGFIISLIIIAINYIIIRRLIKKIDTYEDWIIEFKSDVINTLNKMREIDKQGTFATSISDDKGTFESDDQVGHIFKDIMDLIDKLNERIQ